MGEETITVGKTRDGEAGGSDVELPIVDLLTGRGFVTGKSGSGKSILGGTPVYTETGRKPIEDVVEGERVLSLNKRTYEQEFRPVQARLEHEADDLLRIELEDGTELVGTEDHSFLTVEGLEIVPIRGEDIEEGTWLPLSRELPSPGSVAPIDLAEYAPDSNNVVVGTDTIKSGSKEGRRRLELTRELGRVIGLYLAEGTLDSSQTVQIAATDGGVKRFLGDNGFKTYEKTCNRAFSPFGEFLDTEFGSRSDRKSIPEWVFDAPESFRRGLLSGYFDGDGHVSDSEVTVTSKSPDLIRGIAELLRQFGVSTTIREKMVLYDGDERRFERLTVDAFSVPAFADAVTLRIENKRERLEALCESLSEGGSYNSKDYIPNFGDALNMAARERGWTKRESDTRVDAASIHNLTRKQKTGRETYNRAVERLGIEGRAKRFGTSDVQWKRVVEIERLEGTRTVYDLDVELNDNFVANGVFVHNSNSASVVAEKLLDRGYSLLAVDIDGEYYGLKEEYEILHVGGDDECDLQVDEEHAEKIAELALEGSVPIILDVSSFLEESKARTLLTEVTKHLFAKGKKRKQPFLMLVEEIHEYIPEGGGIDECGRMLIKISKRGRKHGLGIVGISQRPADVKKDFITQCDWLVWHRLTWNNDTKVVSRILGSEYADEIEDMADGEGFLMTDWNESVRRVQFERKRTFDAGATPGLDDFERPELKSVSGDLVDELEEITDERERRENRVNELERELQQREERIRDLERQLAEARDLKRMADRFSRAMMEQVTGRPLSAAPGRQSELEEVLEGPIRRDPDLEAELEAVRNGDREPMSSPVPDAAERDDGEGGADDDANAADGATETVDTGDDTADRADETDRTDEPDGADETDGADKPTETGGTESDGARTEIGAGGADASPETDADSDGGAGGEPPGRGVGTHGEESDSGGWEGNWSRDGTERAPPGSGAAAPSDAATAPIPDAPAGDATGRSDADRTGTGIDADSDATAGRGTTDEAPLVRRLRTEVDALDDVATGMVRQYRRHGPMEPGEAHAAAGGSGDRRPAYAANRRLRQLGLIAHVGCGQYEYALAELIREELTDPVRPEMPPDEDAVAEIVETVEAATPVGDGSAPAEPETSDRGTDSGPGGSAERSLVDR